MGDSAIRTGDLTKVVAAGWDKDIVVPYLLVSICPNLGRGVSTPFVNGSKHVVPESLLSRMILKKRTFIQV